MTRTMPNTLEINLVWNGKPYTVKGIFTDADSRNDVLARAHNLSRVVDAQIRQLLDADATQHEPQYEPLTRESFDREVRLCAPWDARTLVVCSSLAAIAFELRGQLALIVDPKLPDGRWFVSCVEPRD